MIMWSDYKRWLIIVQCGLCLCFVADVEAQNDGRCDCGWFVKSMYAELSNLTALDYLPGTTGGQCRLNDCQNHCAAQGILAQGVDLDQLEDGVLRGQRYCERVYDLVPGDVQSEPIYVLSQVPDCDNFFVWGTTKVYTSNTSILCCSNNTYIGC